MFWHKDSLVHCAQVISTVCGPHPCTLFYEVIFFSSFMCPIPQTASILGSGISGCLFQQVLCFPWFLYQSFVINGVRFFSSFKCPIPQTTSILGSGISGWERGVMKIAYGNIHMSISLPDLLFVLYMIFYLHGSSGVWIPSRLCYIYTCLAI